MCLNCTEPLTAYSGQLTGSVSDASKIDRLMPAAAPSVTRLVAAVDVLVAVFGPFASTVAHFTARPELSDDLSNYAGRAFGTLNATVSAAVLLPLGITLLLVAWATLTQRRWGWQANTALMALNGAAAVMGFFGSPIVSLVRLTASAALLWFWLQMPVREWYGVHDRD